MHYRGENPTEIQGYGNAITHSLKVNIGGRNVHDTNDGNSKWKPSSREPFTEHQKSYFEVKKS
jgi:hypothetical protein